MAVQFSILFINNKLISTRSNIHLGRFIKRLLLIVGVNGAGYEACIRAQTIKFNHVSEYIAVCNV